MNKKQFDLLKTGVKEWNIFREESDERIDLSYANLCHVDLRGVNLSRAVLCEAELSYANINRANLWGADLSGANLIRADLMRANLSRADLSYADLSYAELCDANLSRAHFWGVNLGGANLREANLRRANLQGSDLRNARLPFPQMVLSADWGKLSDELTIQLMRYDAASHPDPKAFSRWASENGPCPYENVNVQRAAFFEEKRKLWSPGPHKKIITLMNMVLKEKTKDWNY